MELWIGILIGAGVVMALNLILQACKAIDYYETWAMVVSNFLVVIPLAVLIAVVCFPCLLVYGFFRHFIISVPQERVDKLWKCDRPNCVSINKGTRKFLTKRIFLNFDPRALKFWNRVFLVRIKKEKG